MTHGWLVLWAVLALMWWCARRRYKEPWYAGRVFGGWTPYSHNGFIPAIIAVIVSVVSAVAEVVMSVGQVLWSTVDDALRGLSSGLTWLWDRTKGFFEAAFQGFNHILHDVVNGFLKLLNDYQAFKVKLDHFLLPVANIFRVAQNIWTQYVQPVFRFVMKWTNAIRKVLGLLKLLHVRWAAKLDVWIAQFQAKVIQVDLQLLGYMREIAGFINLAFDPLGLLRTNVFLRSFIAAIDQVAIAFTGKPWAALWSFDLYGGAGPGKTSFAGPIMQSGLNDIMGRSGDAGDIANRSPTIRGALFNELGVSVPGVTSGIVGVSAP